MLDAPANQTLPIRQWRAMNRVLCLAILVGAPAFVSAEPVDYSRDVRPILQSHCYGCHGPQTQESDYRLDLRERALKGGKSGDPAIIPRDADNSPLIQYVSAEDDGSRMPPADSSEPRLSIEEIATLRAWIDAGPEWPDDSITDTQVAIPLWSLQPLIRPEVPGTQANPIDAFIQTKLFGEGLAPSAAADARTLVRRLSFDLTGLPPTTEELDKFVADARPDAYEQLVDRLLASPRYGEHWARHWLDVVGYADTHGNDHDFARPNAWHYRDYVIRAFNDDMPYARFLEEQVAGDTISPHDPQATVALGLLAAGPWDHTLMVTVREDTVDHHMAQVLDRDNIVSTVMSTFQSMTVHCARCHDHKFDPITQREYYALQAVFAGVDRAERPFDTDPWTHRRRRDLDEMRNLITTRAPLLLATLDTPSVAREVADFTQAESRRERSFRPLEILSVVSTGGSTLARQPDGSWYASGTRPDRDTYIVTARAPSGMVRALRLEAIPDDRLPHRGPGRFDNGHFHLTEFRAFAAVAGTNASAASIDFEYATADQNEGPTMSAAQAIDRNQETHWGIHPAYGMRHEVVFALKQPVEFPDCTTLTILLDHLGGTPGHGLGRFRLSAGGNESPASESTPPPAELTRLLNLPEEERTDATRRELALAVLAAKNARELSALPAPQKVYAVARDFPPDGNFTAPLGPRPIHLLARGDIHKPGELVNPGALNCIPGLPGLLHIPDATDEAARRAALAHWLSDERNALTWRSIVNRVWHYHFGRGLCETPNDFGTMGALPSHPELLDWLAVWFRDDAKGSLKALHRLIVCSATYRQCVRQNAMATDRDGDNRWLWRMNRTRLTAEQFRDSVLLFGGRLDLTMGGPAAVQFIQHGDATFNPGGNPAFLDYEHFDPDAPENRRRAIYRFLFRTVADPFMDALDAPDGSGPTPVRNASTTALQAFALLNDPFLIRQCEHIAAVLKAQAINPETEADAAIQLILARAPQEWERADFALYIQHHGLANACQLLLNSNEFLYID